MSWTFDEIMELVMKSPSLDDIMSGLDAQGDEWLDWRGDFGDGSRWLINKEASGKGWLLHEPITFGCCGATLLPSFQAAVEAFKVFSRRDAEARS